MMHCYRKTKEGENWLYTVGYYEPESGSPGMRAKWVALVDTSSEYEAMALVNYLNGGDGKKFVWNDTDDDLRQLVRDRKERRISHD
jgi:hypothetical protein